MSCTPSRPPEPRIRILAIALASVMLASLRAGAADVGTVSGQIDRLRSTGNTALSAQEPILQSIEQLAQRFYALVDSGQESAALALFRQIQPPMKALYDHNKQKTESMVQATIRADGDLEATQEAPEFKDAEIARLRVMYHLNWVDYLGATLLPESQRRPYLQFAVEGFSELVVGPDPQIARESLFGRAQAHKGLEEWDEALADLKRIVELGPSNPHYAQARVSKVEVLLGARRAQEAAQEAKALVADAAAGQLPAAAETEGRLMRAQALFLSLKQGGGGDRAAVTREALSLLRTVERQGGSWTRKAQAVAQWGLEGLPEASAAAGSGFAAVAVAQSMMLKGKHAEALQQLERAIADGGTPAAQRTTARFYAGLAAFQLKRHASAAKHLGEYLKAAPRGGDAPEASYLLFKALEKVAEEQKTPAAEQAFRQALRTFVERYPQHSAAAEGRFRLAEILREDGDLFGAVEEFRKVRGNPALELYARFNAAQAVFSWLREPPPGTRVEEREQRRAEALADLEKMVADLSRSKDGRGAQLPVEELGSKASLMAAILATEGPSPNYRKALDLTRDFVKRYPNRPELARQAFAIEVLALQKAGDVVRAREAIDNYLENVATDDRARRRLLKRLGREFYVQSENDRAAGREELAQASARIAVAIYERLLGETETSEKTADARRGMYAILGELHAKNGRDPEAAQAYTEVLRINPRSEEALKGLARIATKTGEHEKATRYWQALAGLMDPRDPEWLDTRYAAARSALAGGQLRAGCRFVQETHEKSPYPLVGAEKERFGDLERRLCGG